MKWNGLEFNVQNMPPLDPAFTPMAAVLASHQQSAKENSGKEIAIAIYRSEEVFSVHKMFIHQDEKFANADIIMVERVVKFLLWMKGGYKIIVFGDESLGDYIKNEYSKSGKRAFDAEFMARVYEKEFCVECLPMSKFNEENDVGMTIGGNTEGYRIGFDAGGSDRKVSAVIDGEAVFSEEVVWFPKTNADPSYHYDGIMSALKKAATYLPRIDAIGVSSAGIYVDNRCMVASLFLKVPKDVFDEQVRDIYIRAANEMGAPLKVANDGDVAALAGAIGLEKNSVLGIAMGTSEAVGFVDGEGNIKGWLNELAFAPVDLDASAMEDEWSGDIGCGVKYFSQDGVIKLAGFCGIEFDENLSPAEKLKVIQEKISSENPQAMKIYESIGAYLGHTVALYNYFYKMENVLMMGRTMSGKGGDIILSIANKVLEEEYPNVKVNLCLPDEKTRRVGQSVAAATL